MCFLLCFDTHSLVFSTDYSSVTSADVIFITVGTPSMATGNVDLSYVKGAAIEIGLNLDAARMQIIVNKSTVPVGCGNWVERLVAQGLAAQQVMGDGQARGLAKSATAATNSAASAVSLAAALPQLDHK